MSAADIESVLSGCTLNDPASESAIAALEMAVGFKLPETYCALMRRSSGIEGFVGGGCYIALWPVEQIVELNDAYGVSEFAPGLVFFGSNGGEAGFAFDTRTEGLPIIEVPFIGLSLNEGNPRGRTFDEFMKNLLNA